MGAANTPFYKACIIIGGAQYPVLPGAVFNCPLNLDVPPIIGNFWQLNFGEGYREPTLDCSLVIRDKASSGAPTEVMSDTFLNYFLTRSSSDPIANDTSILSGGIQFWDGRSGYTLTNAKADSFTIGTSKGAPISFNCRFVGSGLTALVSAPTFTQWDRSKVLRFKAVNFTTTALLNRVWNFNLSYSNHHTADMSLNGTAFPEAQNAGQPTAGFQMTCQASTLTLPDNLTVDVSSSPASIAFAITGAAGGGWTRTFTLNNPVNDTPDDRNVSVPRVMRSNRYYCLGVDGQTTGPLTTVVG